MERPPSLKEKGNSFKGLRDTRRLSPSSERSPSPSRVLDQADVIAAGTSLSPPAPAIPPPFIVRGDGHAIFGNTSNSAGDQRPIIAARLQKKIAHILLERSVDELPRHELEESSAEFPETAEYAIDDEPIAVNGSASRATQKTSPALPVHVQRSTSEEPQVAPEPINLKFPSIPPLDTTDPHGPSRMLKALEDQQKAIMDFTNEAKARQTEALEEAMLLKEESSVEHEKWVELLTFLKSFDPRTWTAIDQRALKQAKRAVERYLAKDGSTYVAYFGLMLLAGTYASLPSFQSRRAQRSAFTVFRRPFPQAQEEANALFVTRAGRRRFTGRR